MLNTQMKTHNSLPIVPATRCYSKVVVALHFPVNCLQRWRLGAPALYDDSALAPDEKSLNLSGIVRRAFEHQNTLIPTPFGLA